MYISQRFIPFYCNDESIHTPRTLQQRCVRNLCIHETLAPHVAIFYCKRSIFGLPAIGFHGKRSIFGLPAKGFYGKRSIFGLPAIGFQRKRSIFGLPAIGFHGKRSIFHALHLANNIKDDKTEQQRRQPCRFPRAGSIFPTKKTSFHCISQSQISHLKTHIKTSAPYLAGAYFTPPAIGGHGKRRIFHALDHLNTIKDNKTAQQQRRACRFPRAGSICSAKKTSFYRISQS